MNNTETNKTQDAAEEMRKLVLFDFDGTLTRGDTFGAFLWKMIPMGHLVIGCLKLLVTLPEILFTRKTARAERAKSIILSAFLGSKNRQQLQGLGKIFYQKHLSKMLRPELLETLRQYRDAGARVAVVSASMDIWLQPFCQAERIELICTELAYDLGVFKGRFATPNCNGDEKKQRILATYDLHQFNTVIAYGNSSGDSAMLMLADEAWYCSRDGQLKKWQHNI